MSEKNVDTKKRNIVKAGVAIPVITTLHSRPVFAQSGLCNISGHLSGNLSRPAESCVQFQTMKEPIFWVNHPGCWPNEVIIDANCSQIDPVTGRLIDGVFTTQATLNQLLPNSIMYPQSLLYYLSSENTDELARWMVSSILSYLHPGIDFGTSPQNLADYIELVDKSQTDDITVEKLTDLLIDLGDRMGDADDNSLVINTTCVAGSRLTRFFSKFLS